MVVVNVFLDMAVVVLPWLMSCRSPLGQVLAVSGGTPEFTAFCWNNSALTLSLVWPGKLLIQALLPSVSSAEVLPAVAEGHLGLHLACESTGVVSERKASPSTPQPVWDGGSEPLGC